MQLGLHKESITVSTNPTSVYGSRVRIHVERLNKNPEAQAECFYLGPICIVEQQL